MIGGNWILFEADYVKLCDYLQEHNIEPIPVWFRKQHSTEFAALSLADTMRHNIDQGQMTGAVFIDFRKAFDSKNHSLLLKKLYYGYRRSRIRVVY